MTDPDPVSRRSYLKGATAAGGAALVAGCGGPEGAGDEGPTETPPAETDAQFVTTEFNTIDTNNYNPYDRLSHPNQSPGYLFSDLSDASEKPGDPANRVQEALGFTNKPVLAESETRDGDVVTVEIRDDMTWLNGDPVTAHNVVDRWTLDKLAKDRKWESGAFQDAWVEDDYTAVVRLGEDANDAAAGDFIGNTLVNTHPEVYGQFLPDDGTRGGGAYEDIGNFKRTQLRGDLLNYTVRGAYDPDDPAGTILSWGLWKMKRHGQREMIMEVHEDHPFADRVNFPEVKWLEFTTNQARYQAMLADDFSGLDLVVTETIWDQLQEYKRIYLYNRRLGHGMAINFDRFPDRRVRPAFAYAIDKEQVVANSGLPDPLVTTHQFDSALFDEPTPLAEDRSSRETHDQLFGEGFVDNLTRYDQDTEKAAQLLEDAGYTREDGKWFTPEGDRFSILYKVPPTWTEFVNMVQTEVQHLNDFGIDAEFKTEELVVYYGQSMIQADYDLAHWWTGGARPVPWFAYNTIWNSLQTIGDTHKHPKEYEDVPMPIGDPDGTVEAFNWQEALNEVANTRFLSDRHREVSQQLAWAYNQMLPVYCLNEVNGMATLNTDEWTGPARTAENGRLFFPLTHNVGHKGNVQSLG